jgi:hypothetical protein
MSNKRLAVSSFCIAAFLGAASGGALAGEVTGPPGSEHSKSTRAPDNANSNCAYSGLNDYDPAEGQSVSIVQTVADAWKYYGLPHGFPGTSGACHGGTNESRQK